MNEKVKQALNRLEVILHFMSDRMSMYDLKVIEQAFNDYDTQNKLLKEDKKMIVKEYNRLFDLCKEQKAELNDLREFAKKIAKIPNFLKNNHINDINYKIRNSKYNENERCWLYQDVRWSTDDKNGWFLDERYGSMCFSKERAEELIEKFKSWGYEGAEDLIIVLEYKEAHDRYVLFKKVVEKYGKINN